MLPWESDNNKYRTIFQPNNVANSQVMRTAGMASLDNLNHLQGEKSAGPVSMMPPYIAGKLQYAQELQSQVQEKETHKRQYLESDRKSDWAHLKNMHDNDPFGRPGAGAPIRDQFGNIVTTRKKDPFYVNNPLYFSQLKNGYPNPSNPNSFRPQAQYLSPYMPVKQQNLQEMNPQISLTPQILPSQQKQQPIYHPDPQIQQQLLQQQYLQQQILKQQELLQQQQQIFQQQTQPQNHGQSANHLHITVPAHHHGPKAIAALPTAFNVPGVALDFLQHHHTAPSERGHYLSQSHGPQNGTSERIRAIKADLEVQHDLVKAIEASRNHGLRHVDYGLITHHSRPDAEEEEPADNRSFLLKSMRHPEESPPVRIEPQPTIKDSRIPAELDSHINKIIHNGLEEFKVKLGDEQKQIYKQMEKLKKRRKIADKDLEEFRFLLRHQKEKYNNYPDAQPPIFPPPRKASTGNFDDDDDDESRRRRRRYWLEGEERYDSLLDKYNPYSQHILAQYGLVDTELYPELKNYDFGKHIDPFNRFKFLEDEFDLENRGTHGIKVDLGARYDLPGDHTEQIISSMPVPNDGNPDGAVNIYRKNQERLDVIDKTEKDFRSAMAKSRKGRGEIMFSYID